MNSSAAFVLILVSALIHPFWNILLKASRDKVIFYFNIHLFFTVFFSFILFIYPITSLDGVAWFLVLLSSIAHFFYQLFLCKAYKVGDLSVTYPIVRSAPLFVAAMGFFFLGEKPSLIAVFGIALTVIGAQMINQKELSLRHFINSWRYSEKRIILAAVLTAMFSAMYSVIDKKGVLKVEPVLFFYLFFAFSGAMFGIYLFFSKKRRHIYRDYTNRDKYKITLAAVLEFSSYLLILYAFRVINVAHVVAIRQISVVFGAILGIFILKERYGMIRILASFVVCLGIYFLVAYK